MNRLALLSAASVLVAVSAFAAAPAKRSASPPPPIATYWMDVSTSERHWRRDDDGRRSRPSIGAMMAMMNGGGRRSQSHAGTDARLARQGSAAAGESPDPARAADGRRACRCLRPSRSGRPGRCRRHAAELPAPEGAYADLLGLRRPCRGRTADRHRFRQGRGRADAAGHGATRWPGARRAAPAARRQASANGPTARTRAPFPQPAR